VQLTAIDIRNVRIIEQAAFEPGPWNLLVGPNAAGKTSVLEGIHLLGSGRSFSPGRGDGLIRNGCDWLRVVARLSRGKAGEHRVGLEKPRRGALRLRMDGGPVERLADLAAVVPVLALHPGSHEILSGGPGERRRLLDWGLFHVEPDFHLAWQRFRRGLAQRNQSLRQGASDSELAVWEPEVADSGEAITALRRTYTAALESELGTLAASVMDLPAAVTLDYRPGFSEEQGLRQALAARRGQDRVYCTTTSGPHRAELILRIGGRDSRHRVSRGQQKMLVYLLRLAQARELQKRGRGAPILLLDDVAAELDAEHRTRLLEVAMASGAQLFVTALESGSLPTGFASSASVFHVEQGSVDEVLQ